MYYRIITYRTRLPYRRYLGRYNIICVGRLADDSTVYRSPVEALASTCVRPGTEEHLKSLGAGKPWRTPKNRTTPTRAAAETLYACPVESV